MSRAALAEHVTQPTLSRQIADLEHEMGCQLLVRHAHHVELTEKGVYLRRRAEEIVALADLTEADLKADEDVVEGEVRIAAGETQGMRVVASRIREFQERYPQVRFAVRSGNAADATEQVDRGLADLAVLIDYSDIARYEHVRLSPTDAWCLLFPEGDALASKEAVGPDDIARLPIIASDQALERATLSSWLGPHAGRVNVVARYNLAFNAQMLAREGVGYVLTLDGLTPTGPGTGIESRLLYPPVVSPIDVAWKRDQPRTLAVQKFIELLRKAEAK